MVRIQYNIDYYYIDKSLITAETADMTNKPLPANQLVNGGNDFWKVGEEDKLINDGQ